MMDTQTRFTLIKQVGEEIISEDELLELLKTKAQLIAYDGFEPSGTDIHIAQGIMRSININKMTRAGVKFKMLVADWHAWANNKMGGDLAKIQTVGKYLIEVWKHCGMDLQNVEFVWASDLLKKDSYWKTVMNVARTNTLKRIVRCSQIMGRKENETLYASQILYPCMQAADIFELGADITQLGMDQRKVNMLAREIGPSLGFWKPVVISHHMLMGLGEPPKGEGVDRVLDLKMSKSKPDTAIFMTDTEEDIKRKIKKAHCPEKIVVDNPILEYCRYLIFEKYDALEIKRPEKWGGNVTLENYTQLETAFGKGEIHPADLKGAVAEKINEMVAPVRTAFEKDATLKKLRDEIRGFEVTR